MRKVLLLLIPILLLTGCNDPATDDTYKIELNDPYIICGQTIYFSNDSYNDELDMNDIIETIQDACEVDKLDYAKKEISDIYNDRDLTKEDLLWKLKDIYETLNK